MHLHITFPENGNPSHNFFVVKITFQQYNSPDFKFYLSKLIKIFPIWCNVNFGPAYFAFLLT